MPAIFRGAPLRPRLIVLAVILLLLPVWLPGILGRALWTPDEPREADIAWRMSLQQDHAIPTLAGKPILEKPPLIYWLSAASISIAGLHPAALRAPNLLYAMLATASIVLLGWRLAGARAAWTAGIASGTFLLSFQVAIWLATDAALVAGAALALLGGWAALSASSGRTKLAYYSLMAVGLTIGFMAKGPIAWLVPGCAWLGAVVWNKQSAELRRWELWLPMLLPVLACSAWIVSVLRQSGGSGDLQTLFWWNLVGRFVHLSAPPDSSFAEGHQNWPGKYLIEGVLYVFPWTFLCIAAGRRSWRDVRSASPSTYASRYLAMAIIPSFVILSVSATARGIYAAPLLLPVAALLGLWSQRSLDAPDPFELRMLRWTMYSCALLAGLVLAAAAILAVAYGPGLPEIAAICVAIAAAGLGIATRRGLHRLSGPQALNGTLASGLISLVALAVLLPSLNGAQDLSKLGASLSHDIGGSDLVLYQPDETTVAFVDMSFTPLGRRFDVIEAEDGVRSLIRERPDARLLMKLNGVAAGPLSARLPRGTLRKRGARTKIDTARALALVRALEPESAHLYALPDGRKYLLISPDSSSATNAQAHNVDAPDPPND